MADLRQPVPSSSAARAAGLVLALALAAPPARAQSLPAAPAPPLALVTPPPEPAYLPPTRLPPEGNSASADLEHRAHRKKLTGATLLGVGSFVAVSGLVMLLDGALDHVDPRLCAGRCDSGDLVVAGAIGLGVGTAAAVTGIPVWLSGVDDARGARRLREPAALPIALNF